MKELITKKAFAIIKYMSKSEFAKYLNICRQNLDNKLKFHNWKDYQIEKIDNVYNKIENTENIDKIKFENNKICVYTLISLAKKIIYPS